MRGLIRQGQTNADAVKGDMAGIAQHPGRVSWRQIDGEQMLPAGQNPETANLGQVKTVVFLSRAMPESTILSLLNQGAGRGDVAFVYRGWGDGGVDQMFAYVAGLRKKLDANARRQMPTIMVYPAAFAAYQIDYAPAVLHQDNGRWYLVQGALSLEGTVAAVRQRRFGQRLSQQWKVSEPDQTEVMKARAAQKDWQAQADKAAAAVKRKLAGTMDLPPVAQNSRRLYTPLETIAHDIRDAHGIIRYPRGTRFNLLAIDPAGRRSLIVIDGRDRWQVAYAREVVKRLPQTIVLYTRLGQIADAGLHASPLDKAFATRMQIKAVPTLLRQQGMQFIVIETKPGRT